MFIAFSVISNREFVFLEDTVHVYIHFNAYTATQLLFINIIRKFIKPYLISIQAIIFEQPIPTRNLK